MGPAVEGLGSTKPAANGDHEAHFRERSAERAARPTTAAQPGGEGAGGWGADYSPRNTFLSKRDVSYAHRLVVYISCT
jgi:hypothetical protein